MACQGHADPGMEAVEGRIHITVMGSSTLCAHPLPYLQAF